MDMPLSIARLTNWQTTADLLEALPAGVIICNEHGRIVQTNSELLQLFGYNKQELIGNSIDILLPRHNQAEHQHHIHKYFAAPSKRAMGIGRELFGRRKDDSIFPVEIGLNPVETPDGLHVLATITDITRRQRLEKNFRKMVDAAPVGMLIVDNKGNINHANQYALGIFGYQPDELTGQSIEVLIPQRHREQHPGHRNKYQRQPVTRSMGLERDLTGMHKSGIEIPVEIGLNPIETENGPLVIATIIDITERKKAELKLKQLNTDLDEFTYVASHDLRSPLRGISSLVEWIEEDLAENASEDVKNNLERIHARIAKMEKLVDDLLAYARSGRTGADITSISLQRLLDEVVQFIDPPAAFQVKISGHLDTIRSAVTPLQTVLRNLVSNAIKHHDQGQGKIEIRVSVDDTFCIFEIIDDGPGIPTNAHERVFKLFQTLSSNDGNRSGVGLAVSKRLIEAHGGKIEIHSVAGQRGTCFRFWWPRYARREHSE